MDYAGLTCTSDASCPAPLACVAGASGVRLAAGTCRTGADCPAGRCLDGTVCVPCLANGDCAERQYCDGAQHICRGELARRRR